MEIKIKPVLNNSGQIMWAETLDNASMLINEIIAPNFNKLITRSCPKNDKYDCLDSGQTPCKECWIKYLEKEFNADAIF